MRWLFQSTSQNNDSTFNIRTFILLLGTVCILATLYISQSVWQSSSKDTYSEFYEDSVELEYRLRSVLQNIVQIAVNNANLAANSPLLEISLINNDITALKRSWENMFNSSSSLYQIRLLDLEGNEVFRMDKTPVGNKWIDAQDLQFKGDRDYFISGIATQQSIFVSELDLNKEQDQIEYPLRPTIRATAKYVDETGLVGLVVLNYDLRSEFDFFAQQQNQLSHWIMKNNGYFLSSPDGSEWGWLLNKPDGNGKMVFGEAFLSQIMQANGGYDASSQYHIGKVTIGSQQLDAQLSETEYWVITEIPELTRNNLESFWLRLLFITAIVVILIVLVGLYIDKLILKMHKKELAAIELAELARQSERTKTKFLAQMSHEIRTPMNGVFGLLQLTYGERNQQKINDNLRSALRSFESLRRIIDDILDFSKIEAGKLQLVSQVIHLDLTLKDVSQSMSRAAYGKSIDMWIDIDPSCPRECYGDPIRLNQILFNLTNNAIKFTEQGEIHLNMKLRSENDKQYQLGFELSDTGIGMTLEESNQIFESFTQASERTHSNYGGTGLGLTIVKQLVSLMGGNIQVLSERGKGTQFNFDIWVDKSINTSRFSDPILHQEDRNVEAFIVSESELATTILSKHCASLGWPSRNFTSLSGFASARFANNDHIKVLIIESTKPLSADMFGQLQTIKDGTADLIVVHVCTVGVKSDISSTGLIDVTIDKPVTPSELYDKLLPYTHLESNEHDEKTNLNSTVLASKHILLVEDNELNQMVANSMLENAGAKVSIANNGQQCIDMLEKDPTGFDLILMDMQMPVMDGITATIEIRQRPQFEALPIVALTANAMEEEVQACINAGMQAHVAKPIDKNVMVQTIYAALRGN